MTGYESKRAAAQDKLEPWDNEAFSNWWDADYDDRTNPYEKDSFAYWAWAGWQAALAQPAQKCPNIKNCGGACFQCEYFNAEKGEMEYPVVQPAQEPVATLFGTLPVYDNTPALPAQEPVAWLCSPDENGLFELPTTHKACKDCFPVYTTLPQPAQEREALKLALEVLENLPGFRADIDNAITVIKDVLEKTHEN